MKKIFIKIACLAFAGAAMTSCGDFLTIVPPTLVTEDNFWDEENDVNQIMYGIYNQMQGNDFLSRVFIWGESRGDNVDKHHNMAATSDIYKIMEGDIRYINSYTDWTPFYKVINRCNLIIEKSRIVHEKDANFTTGEMNAIIAEASAIRGLCYFYLARTYMELPYYTYAFTSSEQDPEMFPISNSQVVDNVIQNLVSVRVNALKVFPKVNGQDMSYARMTQDAIDALLADMYLWKGDFINAEKSARDLILAKYKRDFKESFNNNEYSTDYVETIADEMLTRAYSDVGGEMTNAYNSLFGTGGDPETIFELDFSDNTNDGSASNSMISSFYFSAPSNTVSDGSFRPSELLVYKSKIGKSGAVFDQVADARFVTSIYVPNYDDPKEQYIMRKYGQRSMSGYSINGSTIQITGGGTGISGRPNKDDSNWIFYRTSDVMLILAEALAYQLEDTYTDEQGVEHPCTESDKYKEAVAYVKAVYQRSFKRGTSMKLTASTKKELLDVIMLERQREFLFEGKRWFDLVRYARHMNDFTIITDAITASGRKCDISKLNSGNTAAYYWPIHETELEVNRNLKQNPAYPEGDDESFELQ